MLRDRTIAEQAVTTLLEEFGCDLASDALRDTPARVVRAWEEMLAGYDQKPSTVLERDFDADGYDQQVLCRKVPFYSTCEHHLLPFHGIASIAYVPQPGGRVVGLSKLARLVELHARRLQLQERMTQDIANDLQKHLKCKGVAVVIQATHLCMCARGVRKPGSEMVTSVMLGCYRDSTASRNEILLLLGGS